MIVFRKNFSSIKQTKTKKITLELIKNVREKITLQKKNKNQNNLIPLNSFKIRIYWKNESRLGSIYMKKTTNL